MSGPIAFDTSVIVPLLKSKPVDKDLERQVRAEALIEELRSESIDLVLPAPALAEILCWEEIARSMKRDAFIKYMLETFQVPALDGFSVLNGAEFFERAFMNKDQDLKKQCVRTDAMIIAVAVEAGCSVIYAEDQKHFPRIAGDKIQVKELPVASKDGELFET